MSMCVDVCVCAYLYIYWASESDINQDIYVSVCVGLGHERHINGVLTHERE